MNQILILKREIDFKEAYNKYYDYYSWNIINISEKK